jgi:hypothetical protein
VLAAHVRADLVDPRGYHVDQSGLDAIGRMGGHGYARTREYFDLPTMSFSDWGERRVAARRFRDRPKDT